MGHEHASVGERGRAWGWTPASSQLVGSGCEAARRIHARPSEGQRRVAHRRRNIFSKSLLEFALSTLKRKGSYRVKSLLGAYEADTERPEPARSYQAVSGSYKPYQARFDICLIYEANTPPVYSYPTLASTILQAEHTGGVSASYIRHISKLA